MKFLPIFAGLLFLCAICLAQDDPQYFDWKGNKLMSDKNYSTALSYFTKAVTLDPNFGDAWTHKGDAESMLKNFNASIISFLASCETVIINVALWVARVMSCK